MNPLCDEMLVRSSEIHSQPASIPPQRVGEALESLIDGRDYQAQLTQEAKMCP